MYTYYIIISAASLHGINNIDWYDVLSLVDRNTKLASKVDVLVNPDDE